ncbi:hypothetical protein [Streptomyces sp. ODS05-4]|uniref:hypothetical protein n=1 Tax=Streptomyces sp. ODS05-4 TaxID=2944939 RepID=UPI00210E180B|nr:hypothetical protein [Streptomyces sp. ODS05-4]
MAADELRALAGWALRRPEVELRADGGRARLTGGGESREVAVAAGRFPDYRTVLDSLPRTAHRVIVERDALREAAGRFGDHRAVVLRTAAGELEVSAGDGAEPAVLRAVCSGGPLRIAFDPGVLDAALSSGVGPDVLLDVADATQPVVVRSADQGSFTSLAMPVRNEHREAAGD